MEELEFIAESMNHTFEAMYDITFTEDWKAFNLEDQLQFQAVVEEYYAAACIIREKFDSDVWKGHSNGTVDRSIKSVRKQYEGKKPGKKAEPVTASSLLAKRLKK